MPNPPSLASETTAPTAPDVDWNCLLVEAANDYRRRGLREESHALYWLSTRLAGLLADRDRVDWLQENAYQLSTVSEGETCDAVWDVFPNDLDLDEDTEPPSGRGVREAIDAARLRPERPEGAHRKDGTFRSFESARIDPQRPERPEGAA